MSLKPPAPIYLVHYTDLCRHEDTSSKEFFDDKGLCHLLTVGFIRECEVNGVSCIKVLHYHDLDGGSNSEGIVIQKSVIIEIRKIK